MKITVDYDKDILMFEVIRQKTNPIFHVCFQITDILNNRFYDLENVSYFIFEFVDASSYTESDYGGEELQVLDNFMTPMYSTDRDEFIKVILNYIDNPKFNETHKILVRIHSLKNIKYDKAEFDWVGKVKSKKYEYYKRQIAEYNKD
jgi:hypothetical protein